MPSGGYGPGPSRGSGSRGGGAWDQDARPPSRRGPPPGHDADARDRRDGRDGRDPRGRDPRGRDPRDHGWDRDGGHRSRSGQGGERDLGRPPRRHDHDDYDRGRSGGRDADRSGARYRRDDSSGHGSRGGRPGYDDDRGSRRGGYDDVPMRGRRPAGRSGLWSDEGDALPRGRRGMGNDPRMGRPDASMYRGQGAGRSGSRYHEDPPSNGKGVAIAFGMIIGGLVLGGGLGFAYWRMSAPQGTASSPNTPGSSTPATTPPASTTPASTAPASKTPASKTPGASTTPTGGVPMPVAVLSVRWPDRS